MENKKNNSNLKAIVVVLLLLLLGSLGYIFKMTTDAEIVRTELKTSMTDKESVMNDLKALKATYDASIAENTSMSEELIKEREKVLALMSDLKKSSNDVSKFKSQLAVLQNSMKVLIAENAKLTKQNVNLTTERDSSRIILANSKKENEELTNQNSDLVKTVEKGSVLSVINLKGAAFKVRSSGQQIETEKANRANVIKVSFTIAENKISKTGTKTYYVQVIDSENNIIGDKKVQSFGTKSLTYSFISNVKYENKAVNVSQDLAAIKFAKGNYIVNIFDKDELVSKTTFTLR
jgi:cytochrome c556